MMNLLSLALCGSLLTAPPKGDAVIRAKAGPSDIVITTTNRVAGAIHSLTWNGEEFIDSHDHGRQLQSASSFDAGKPGEFWAEAFNPTEAGSLKDHTGPRSTSVLQSLKRKPNSLETQTRMAFWLTPCEQSFGRPALNTTVLSNHVHKKHVIIGVPGMAHAIDYRVTFSVPKGEGHKRGQLEALTGYMPAKFSRFETFDPATNELSALSDGPGEQHRPIVFSTPSGGHAMGIISFDRPKGQQGPSYGRFRFAAENVVKWNAVYRVNDPIGDFSFRLFVTVGSRENVRVTFQQLRTAFGP